MLARSVFCGLACLVFAAFPAGTARAGEGPLLIQVLKDGSYKVWNSDGGSRVTEEELMALEASARPGGGETLQTAAGPGRAYETAEGIVIVLPRLRDDGSMLLDRDACGHIKVWHAERQSRLTEEQMTELYLTALPDGGKRMRFGNAYAKGYLTRLGVVVVLWPAPAR
ncbi:MAG: hypothetical protein JNM82_06825 [Rhodocyclaceae bacterium]|nr:hypothetical protein [Rhodocyclaceae bacterium]